MPSDNKGHLLMHTNGKGARLVGFRMGGVDEFWNLGVVEIKFHRFPYFMRAMESTNPPRSWQLRTELTGNVGVAVLSVWTTEVYGNKEVNLHRAEGNVQVGRKPKRREYLDGAWSVKNKPHRITFHNISVSATESHLTQFLTVCQTLSAHNTRYSGTKALTGR
jgi:hypothetical protein